MIKKRQYELRAQTREIQFSFFQGLGGGKVKMVASSLPAQGDIIYRRV